MTFNGLLHALDELKTSIQAFPDIVNPQTHHDSVAENVRERLKNVEKEFEQYTSWEKRNARLIRLARETILVQKGEMTLRRSLTLARRRLEDETALRRSGQGWRHFAALVTEIAREVSTTCAQEDTPFFVDFDDAKFEAANNVRDDVKYDGLPLTLSVSKNRVTGMATLEMEGTKLRCSKVDITCLESDDVTVSSVSCASEKDLCAAFNCALEGDTILLRGVLTDWAKEIEGDMEERIQRKRAKTERSNGE